MTEKQIIKALKARDTQVLKEVYNKYQAPFMSWVRAKYPTVNVVVFEDVYSEAVLDFYENIIKGKYKHSAAIKTYLFTLGRNKVVNIINKKITHSNKEGDIIKSIEHRTIVNPEQEQYENENAHIIKNLMHQLCNDCQKVLTLFYFHEHSMVEIAEKMGYKNANVAKSKKRDCFKKIAKLAQEQYEKADFFNA